MNLQDNAVCSGCILRRLWDDRHGYKYETEGEKMSGTVEGWNGRKLPKNIRQVGETEGQNRIYLEDYVYTYVRKALEKRSNQAVAGVLTGTWEDKEIGRCYFIKGAMVVEGLLSAKESVIEGSPLWKKNRELAEYYFPGQELVGWFLHSREEGLFDETEKQTMHRHIFSQGESLFFQFEEEENKFYFGDDTGLALAGGFYIYYERNVDMQNYMLDTGQAVPEEISLDDTAILQYRSIMKERKNQAGRKQEALLKRACIGLTAAVVFLSLYTWGEQRVALPGETGSGIEEILAVGASVEELENDGETDEAGESQGMSETDYTLDNQNISGTEGVVDAQNPSGTEWVIDGQDSSGTEGIVDTPNPTESGTALENQVPSGSVDSTEPAESAAAGVADTQMNYYEVQSGDTLVSICLTFYGTTEVLADVCQVNGISNPALIYNGQRIYLP